MDDAKVDKLLAALNKVRDERIDLLPERGNLVEAVADAMNALEIAWVMLANAAHEEYQNPQGATFIPTSDPKDAQPL